MDEISYWIYTKRAPCLFSLDNAVNKDPVVCYPNGASVHSNTGNPPAPEKKKRKLALLDDESLTTVERQQNLYFDVSQTKIPHLNQSECRSHSKGSDINFNVKKTSVHNKRKKTKLHKPSRTTRRKNKVVTSTPKTTTLRRSLRKIQNCLNNNSQLNSSYELLNHDVNFKDRSHLDKVPRDKMNATEKHNGDDQLASSKPDVGKITKRTVLAHDQYEDLSDVSGFTANYIRSTKIHSNKTHRKLKSKVTKRNLMKGSYQSTPRGESRMIVCMNKAVNTGLPQTVDCSTDSSQYVLNSVTVTNNDKSRKVNKCTSELKFIDPKINNNISTTSDSKNTISNADMFSPRTLRYSKRHNNIPTTSLAVITDKVNNPNGIIVNRRKKAGKNSTNYNNSDRKENPTEKSIPRTRSGRNVALTLRQPENSVLVVSNSTEQVSSRATLDVGSPQVGDQQCDNRKRRKRVSVRQMELKRSVDKCGSSHRESLRDRSGFAACFSESDDSEPLKQKKFFC